MYQIKTFYYDGNIIKAIKISPIQNDIKGIFNI